MEEFKYMYFQNTTPNPPPPPPPSPLRAPEQTCKARGTATVVGVDGVLAGAAVIAVVEDAVVDILLSQEP